MEYTIEAGDDSDTEVAGLPDGAGSDRIDRGAGNDLKNQAEDEKENCP